jgi:hypothetical protein
MIYAVSEIFEPHGSEQPSKPEPTRRDKRIEAKQSAAAGNSETGEVKMRPGVWTELRTALTRSGPAFEIPVQKVTKKSSLKDQLIAVVTRSTPAFRGRR